MNPIKTLLFTLSLFALFAANAAAQCGGKTVHILLPDDWGKTTITYMWEGQYKDITLTKSGNWYSFTFPSGLSNDNMQQNSGKGQNFWFSKASSNGNPNSGQNNWIAKGQWWNKSGNAPDNTNAFFCSDFGSGSNLYISPNPNQPSSTVSDANPPNAKVFYFFPPDDPKWIAGKSYITADPDNPNAAKLMGVDQKMCGWYMVVYFNEEPPDYVQIWLGASGVDKIGSNGREDDLDEGNGVSIAQIGALDLKDKFNSVGDTLYFVADNGYADGWSNIDPGTDGSNRCRYELAAFIYDTDASVHQDFSCGVYKEEGKCKEAPSVDRPGQNSEWKCTGVIKGLAKSTLNKDTKKIECGNCTKNSCWTDAEWFSKAFTATKGVNVQHCYDMLFTQAKNGRYEFDSDVMTQDGTPNGKLVGGFFPKLLDDAKSTDAAYADCPACATKRTAEVFVPIDEKTWDRDTYMSYQSKENDFANGDADPKNAWDWGARDKLTWYLWGSTAIAGNKSSLANELFCFESHANFIYDPEQEFYFTGDDDIWVYVNDTLVVDLGGAHLAAPGHIKLKDIKGSFEMTPGKEYPIDIFFCDRRTTQSNVRISTNMYVTQKSSFDKKPEKDYVDLCADISGGADCASKMGMNSESSNSYLCAEALLNSNQGFTVEFFMHKKNADGGRDTVWLSGSTNPECSGNSTEFTCYGGIKVNKASYSCGGKKKCQGDPDAIAKVNIAGNWTVDARLMKNGAQVGKSVNLDNFKSEANTRIIWGKIASYSGKVNTTLKDAYGGNTAKEQRIIAGKRTPIYVSSGSWQGDTFSYDDEDITAGAITYTLTGAGNGLRVFRNKDSETPLQGNMSSIPASGIDTIWVEADYTVKNNTPFSLNVVNETADAPSMKLTVYQPTLRFMTEDFGSPVTPSGWQSFVPGSTRPPYVGTPLAMYIEAYDPERKELCGHCSFTLSETSTHNNPGISNKDIVKADGGLRLENGRATIYIRGSEDTGPEQYTATWEISVPRADISASWDKLRFVEAPIPLPMRVYVYDRNGDGIADSLRAEYSKSFNGKGDSLLPALLAVVWAKGDTLYFHADNYKREDLQNKDYVLGLYKDASFFANNRKYWNSFIEQDSIIVLSGKDLKFSKEIQTAPVDIGGRPSVLLSFVPYIDTESCTGPCGDKDFKYDPQPSNLIDRVPPIVVRAEYLYASSNKGNCEESKGCKETLTAYLSEPIWAGPEANDEYLLKNPFSYCFGRSQTEESCKSNELDSASQRFNQEFDNYDWKWELAKGADEEASSAVYKPNTKTADKMAQPGSKGDSIVELTYWAGKTAFGTTRMPKADDWIKIRMPKDGNIFNDAEGNAANPRERGVLIKGTNPSKKLPIKIAGVRPGDPPLGGIFAEGGQDLYWWSDEAKKLAQDPKDGLFIPGNVAELLPVPKEISGSADSIKKYYPASVGTVFDIADKIHNDVNTFFDKDGECETGCKTRSGELLTKDNVAKAITVRASAYYHTNLGNYTAHRGDVNMPCTSPIFQNRNGTGNCYTSESNYYLAWDLRANSGRYVGAGAYVGISKFYLQLDYQDARGKDRSKKLSEEEFIEMFGVTRPKAGGK